MICYVTNTFTCGAVAQLGERLNGIQEVESSILFGSTKNKKSDPIGSLFCLFALIIISLAQPAELQRAEFPTRLRPACPSRT